MSTKADGTFVAFFVIGLVFVILGATTEIGFVGAGIPFLILGMGGFAYSRSKAKGEGDGAEKS